MPDPQRLIRRDHHFGLIDKPVAQHRRPLDPQRTEIRLGMGDLGIRPLSPRLPERLAQPALLIGIKIPTDPCETQKQLFHPLLVKTPGQRSPFGFAQQGVDHRRRLQCRRQRLKDAIARQRIHRHRRIADPYPVIATHLRAQDGCAAAGVQVQINLRFAGKKRPSHGRIPTPLATVRQQLRLARQPGAGHVHRPLPVALAVGPPRHPRPAVLKAFHGAGGVARGALPAIEQADRLRPAQALAERRCLTPTGFDQKVCAQAFAAFDVDAMPIGE